MNGNDFLKIFCKNFSKKRRKKQTPCLLSLIVISLQLISSCVKKEKQQQHPTGGCLLSLVTFLLLLKSSFVKKNNTELWIGKSTAILPKSHENQTLEYYFAFPLTIKLTRNAISTIRRVQKRKNSK